MENKKIKWWHVLLTIFIIVGCIVCVGRCNSTDKAPTKSGYLTTRDDYFFYATGAAVAIVSKELNYPSSSEFESQGDMSVYYNKNDDTYKIMGYVNAANAFGVKTKKYFTVITQLSVSGDKYSYYNYSCTI